ncbi:MAG TPA: YgiT-type zinc finger protein [Longimicrobiaceae bacterium]|nr:YgiT-type zinc finger protein [Longimicrobiaceae bacterium]
MDPERRADTDVGAAEPWAAVQQALWAWRRAHPRATFTEIEDAVDQQFAALRAQVLADLSLASRAADVQAKQAGAPPRCPACGTRLIRQGTHHRQVVVQGGQAVHLERDYAVCPACGTGLFPPG